MSKVKVICNYLTTYLIKGVLETNTNSSNPLKTYAPHNVGKINSFVKQALHKKGSFPLGISSVKKCLMENFMFCVVKSIVWFL